MVTIQTKKDNDIYEILVDGEIDASSSIHLDNALEEAFMKSKKVLVNLEQLKYISSAGLGVFIARLDEMKSNNIKMVFFGLTENVKQVFTILGIMDLLIIKLDKSSSLKALNET